MSRKRSRVVKLALLGTASLFVGGCGGCDDHQQGADFPNVDPILARKAVAAGTSAVVSDAFLLAGGMIASGPGVGVTAPLNAARLGYVLDQAVETADVTRHESGLAKSTQPGHNRSHYRYHHGPGIGWFLWGYMLSRSTTGTSRPYAPPPRYGSTPRPFNTPGSGGGRSFAGGSSSGRSSGAPSTGGSVSRGGFGSSGSAHASGGSS